MGHESAPKSLRFLWIELIKKVAENRLKALPGTGLDMKKGIITDALILSLVTPSGFGLLPKPSSKSALWKGYFLIGHLIVAIRFRLN